MRLVLPLVLFLVAVSGCAHAPPPLPTAAQLEGWRELTTPHFLLAFSFPRQPRWFAEGMASYLERVWVNAEGDRVGFGHPHLEALEYLRRAGLMSLDRLWTWGERCDSFQSTFHCYASSWQWVHYLGSEHPEAWVEFQVRLAHAESPRQAFEAAFAGYAPEALEEGALTHLKRAQMFVLTQAFTSPPAFPDEERRLRPAQVHLVRARLQRTNPHLREAKAREHLETQELQAALALEPDLVAAQARLLRLTHAREEARGLLQALVAAHPESGEAWSALGDVLEEQDATKVETLRRALALRPDDAHLLNSLAWCLVQQGNTQEGLPLASRAVRLRPWDARVVDTLAAALFKAGRCPEAVEVQQRAVDMLVDGAPPAAYARFAAVLAEYARACP